jgi:hypothetical protein
MSEEECEDGRAWGFPVVLMAKIFRKKKGRLNINLPCEPVT